MTDEAMELARQLGEMAKYCVIYSSGRKFDFSFRETLVKASARLAQPKAASAGQPGQINPKEARNGDACGAAPDSGEMPEEPRIYEWQTAGSMREFVLRRDYDLLRSYALSLREREGDKDAEIVAAAKHFVEVSQSHNQSQYSGECGRHGNSPWAELVDALPAAPPASPAGKEQK